MHGSTSLNFVSHESFFEEAAALANEHTKGWDHSMAWENHKRIHGNIVGVIGAAGIGKTTMTKVIIRKIFHDALYNVQFIFYIRFSDIRFERDTTLLKFLLSSSNIDWEENEWIDNEIVKVLDQRCNVIIIMDGLNELIMPNFSNPFPPSTTLYEKAKAVGFIRSLFGGKLLPNAKKLLTSRPRQMYELQHEWRPRCIFNILGINETSQRKICKEICRESYEIVFECISINPSLSSYCRIPLNCILVMQSIQKHLKQSNVIDVFGSVTEIFVSVLEMFVRSDYLSGNFVCEGLPELAWTGISASQNYFTEDEMKKAGVTSKIASAFFNLHVEAIPGTKVLDGSKKSSFIHPMLREFLAAVKLVQTTDIDQFRQNIDLLHQSHFEMVAKFLFGLCRRTVLTHLKRIGLPTNISQEDDRLKILKEFAVTTLQKALASRRRSATTTLFRVCACVYEMHDHQFAEEVGCVLGNKLSIAGNVFPHDIAGFCYVLQTKKAHAFELCLGPCIKFIGNSFCQFFDRIYDATRDTCIILAGVDVSRNKVGDEEATAVSRCLHHITSLNLSDCQLSTSQVKIITDQVQALNSNLYELYLAYNHLDDEAVSFLVGCVHKIDRLHASRCNFSDLANQHLCAAISARPTPLTHFCYSGNVTNEKLVSCSICVGNIKQLIVGFKHEKTIVIQGIEKLCLAIEKLPEPMQSLFIRGSHIGDEGFYALSKCLKNINNLKIGCTYDDKLTSLGIRELSSAILSLNSPMQSLLFCCPDRYVDEAKAEFSYCDKQVLKLEIR